MTYNFRAREEARRREREAFDRRSRRISWTGLSIPVIVCTVAALIIRPDSWFGWATVIASAPAAATGFAVVLMLKDRRERSTP